MDSYAVVGNPVEHSLSPRIHQAFAKQTGQAITYRKLLAPLDAFAETVTSFIQQGGQGLNVTVPFKEQATKLADNVTERARLAGAVNTLTITPQGLYGDNTDGHGLLTDLSHNLNLSINGKRLLILGAGGSARGILLPLGLAGAQEISIANRTYAKAQALVEQFHGLTRLNAYHYEELKGLAFDIIINCTSSTLQGIVPPLYPENILANGCCYDVMYSSKETNPFLQWGQQQGARTCSTGWGMLVEQAAESFFIWRGVKPDTRTVLRGRIRRTTSN